VKAKQAFRQGSLHFGERMNHQVQIFEVGKDAKPTERPRAIDGFAVTADTVEEARRAVLARLEAEGRSVRSLSFTADGGIAVVVHAEAQKLPAVKAGR
jgi:hypothetical protein